MPVMFFVLTVVIATVGAGNIAGAALMAPMAMAVAGRARIPAFLMTVMVAHGAVAGGMSPFAPTGITANKIMAQMGMPGLEWRTYLYTLIASALAGFAGYLVFGGWRLFRTSPVPPEETTTREGVDLSFRPQHWVTLSVIAGLIVAVVGFRADVGMASFTGALLLTIFRMADESAAIRAMPWGVILMVCGVTVLTKLLERTGGMELFTRLLAALATPGSITGVIALVTGLVSAYSSTTGVVLPAFLPTVPGLVKELGGADPVAVASSIIVGGNLVDVSPLSTIGALCVASAPAAEDRRVLFNRVLAWGMSMAVVGAAVCQVLFGWLR